MEMTKKEFVAFGHTYWAISHNNVTDVFEKLWEEVQRTMAPKEELEAMTRAAKGFEEERDYYKSMLDDKKGSVIHNTKVWDASHDDIPEVVLEAVAACNGPRNKSYGHALENFTNIAGLHSTVLKHPITPLQAILLMDNVKTSRLMHTPDHKDSIVDKIGYMICYWRCLEAMRKV